MPKAPKSPARNSLVEEYAPSDPWKNRPAKRQKRTKDPKDEEPSYVDDKSSRRILEIGRKLQEEDDQEIQRPRPQAASTAFDLDTRIGDEGEGDDDGELGPVDDDDDAAWGEEDEVEDDAVDPKDLATWNKFFPTDENPVVWPGEEAQPSGPGTDLAALILAKIAAHENQGGEVQRPEVQGGGDPDDAIELPAKVVEVYSKIGLILSRYKTGKLPKAFKILPTIPVWETLVAITHPEEWTPNAMFAATRIFISAKPQTAQIFLNTILLPCIQEHIQETHKLNVHLYNALKKALYKPSAFFKGLVFPMLTDSTCTQRQAIIVASVVAKVSVPVLHSAAALLRVCEIAAEQMSSDPDAAGPCNIFIRTLLEKKYALPFKVVDALVFHFLRFRGTASVDAMDIESQPCDLGGEGKLPVIWHQCLLAFARRYRNDITEDQREALLDLLLTRGHKSISPEVRRELLQGRGRGVMIEQPAVGMDGDDTMIMG